GGRRASLVRLALCGLFAAHVLAVPGLDAGLYGTTLQGELAHAEEASAVVDHALDPGGRRGRGEPRGGPRGRAAGGHTSPDADAAAVRPAAAAAPARVRGAGHRPSSADDVAVRPVTRPPPLGVLRAR
ncbi:unnamed protein product, partial [Prorocentrum cordatum]